MRITLLTVGENKFPFFKKGEALYLERLSHYVSISIESVASERMTRNKSESYVLSAETLCLRSRIPKDAFVCALDRKGKSFNSEEFAMQIQKWQNRNITKLYFCIGGPIGLDPEFVEQSDFILSLSSMTLPHDLVRVVFLEQLYRAFTILKGEKYHK